MTHDPSWGIDASGFGNEWYNPTYALKREVKAVIQNYIQHKPQPQFPLCGAILWPHWMTQSTQNFSTKVISGTVVCRNLCCVASSCNHHLVLGSKKRHSLPALVLKVAAVALLEKTWRWPACWRDAPRELDSFPPPIPPPCPQWPVIYHLCSPTQHTYLTHAPRLLLHSWGSFPVLFFYHWFGVLMRNLPLQLIK